MTCEEQGRSKNRDIICLRWNQTLLMYHEFAKMILKMSVWLLSLNRRGSVRVTAEAVNKLPGISSDICQRLDQWFKTTNVNWKKKRRRFFTRGSGGASRQHQSKKKTSFQSPEFGFKVIFSFIYTSSKGIAAFTGKFNQTVVALVRLKIYNNFIHVSAWTSLQWSVRCN